MGMYAAVWVGIGGVGGHLGCLHHDVAPLCERQQLVQIGKRFLVFAPGPQAQVIQRKL